MATVHLYSAVLFLFCLTEYDRVCGVCVCACRGMSAAGRAGTASESPPAVRKKSSRVHIKGRRHTHTQIYI